MEIKHGNGACAISCHVQMMFQENKVAPWEAEYTLVENWNFAGLFPQEMTFAGRGTPVCDSLLKLLCDSE